MQIKYNPALDLFTSMMLFTRWNEVNELCKGSSCPSRELTSWYEETKIRLPGPLKNELNYYVKDFIGLTFLPVSLILTEGLTDVQQTLRRLKELNPEELPERLFETYQPPLSWAEAGKTPEKIRKALEKAGGTIRKGEPELFIEFCRFPGLFWERFLNIAGEFYLLALKERENEIRGKMAERIREDQKILISAPERFFKGYFRMDPPSSGTDPAIFICFYDEIDIIQIETPDTLIYGWRRGDLKERDVVPLEETYRILADESRRTILQLLCRRPWFIRELASELSITSATVSYHVSRLGALDLVRYERGEKNRVYYQADLKKVRDMLDVVKESILGKV